MDIGKYNKSLANKEYVKGRNKETEYYILTAKFDEKNYKLTLLRNNSIILERYYEGLTAAKYGAFEWLFNYDSTVFEKNKVTMVHYKEDRPNGDPWVKDTNIELHKNLEAYLKSKSLQQETTTNKDMTETQESQTWIFQGNPMVFDVDNYVNNHKYIWWSMRQEHFVDKIQLNDTVFLWRSDGGKRGTGGILAKARVVSLPKETTDDDNAEDYWHTDDWANPYLAVKLEVLEVRLEDGFISRLILIEHPVLKDLLILRLRQQTNYLLPQEQGEELQKLWDTNNSNTPNELDSIGSEITETEKEQVIKSRIGQSTFKKALLAIEKKCRLCGISDERFLVASHIKPWSKSSNQERLDVNNGLLICPNHDALFDKGLISFGDDGTILISDSLDELTIVFLNINETMNIKMNESQQQYIKWHRKNIFLK